MEYTNYINPIKIYEGIKDGTIAQKVDNRLLSALVVLFGFKLA
jgi:hypothetical protein